MPPFPPVRRAAPRRRDLRVRRDRRRWRWPVRVASVALCTLVLIGAPIALSATLDPRTRPVAADERAARDLDPAARSGDRSGEGAGEGKSPVATGEPAPASTATSGTPTGAATAAGPPPTGSGAPPAPPTMVDEIVARTNEERAAAGRAALTVSACATEQAAARTALLAAEDRFEHDPLEPVLSACGAGTAGENLALGYPTALAVVAGWMGSPGHRDNILGDAFTQIGVGCAQGPRGLLCAQVFLG